MFNQNTSVVIKATKYEIDIFASQVARNHAIAVYAYWPYNRKGTDVGTDLIIGKKWQNLCGHFKL